jgi:hypothetical protein
MEAQRSKNFNEFYRSTGEHLVNIRAPRMFWEGALPRKFANFKVQNEECHYYETYAQTKRLEQWLNQKGDPMVKPKGWPNS